MQKISNPTLYYSYAFFSIKKLVFEFQFLAKQSRLGRVYFEQDTSDYENLFFKSSIKQKREYLSKKCFFVQIQFLKGFSFNTAVLKICEMLYRGKAICEKSDGLKQEKQQNSAYDTNASKS